MEPPGFKESQLPHFVCKLHKSIYGLKQVPRAWFDKLLKFLIHFGLGSKADSSLFIFLNKLVIVILLIYVHDL